MLARDQRTGLLIALSLSAVSIAIQTLFFLDAPLWRDEAISVFIAKLPTAADIVEALARDGAAPLFYFLLRGWITVFGDADAALRAFAILLSSLAPAALYLAGKNLLGRRVALLAALWFLSQPFQLDAGRQVRMYCLLPLLGIAAIYGWTRFLRDGRWQSGLLGALGNLLLAYSHNVGLVALAGTQIAVALTLVAGGKQAMSVKGPRWMALQALIGIGYLPWLPVLWRQLQGDVAPWAGAAPIEAVVLLLWRWFVPGTLGIPLPVLAPLALGIFATMLYALLMDRRGTWPPALLRVYGMAALGISLLAAITQFQGAFSFRYVLPWVPMLGLGVFGVLGPALQTRGWGPLIVGLVLAGNLAGIGMTRRALLFPTNAREVARSILREGSAADWIVIAWEPGAPAISRYLPPDFGEQQSFPALGRVENVNWPHIRDRLADENAFQPWMKEIESAAHRGMRIWLVCRDEALRAVAPSQPLAELPYMDLEVERQRQILAQLREVTGSEGVLEVDGPLGGEETFVLLRFDPPREEAITSR